MPEAGGMKVDKELQTLEDRFELAEEIGAGGFGTVYKAKQKGLDRRVALKVLRADCFQNVEIARFEQEAKILCQLNHENICQVYAYGKTDKGQPYLVLELLDGKPLCTCVSSLTVEEIISIAMQSCRALQRMNAHNVIHRDLKPSNIMLMKDGTKEWKVKLLDFGLSKFVGSLMSQKLTQTGMFVGSVQYASPEQCLAKTVDHRTDVYSLGCILYEVLAGRPPHFADNAIVMMQKHLYETPESLHQVCADRGYPPALADCIHTAVAKDPADRFQDFGEFLRSLENCQMQLSSQCRQLPKPVSVQNSAVQSKKKLAHKSGLIEQGVYATIAVASCCLLLGGAWLFRNLSANRSVNNAESAAHHGARAMDTGDPTAQAVRLSGLLDEASACNDRHEHERAQEILEKLFAELNKLKHPIYPIAVAAHVQHALSLSKLNHFDAAVDELDGAVQLVDRELPTDIELRSWAIETLGETLLWQGNLARAEVVLFKAYQFRKNAYGPEALNTAYSLEALGHVYCLMHRPEDARFYLSKAIPIFRRKLGDSSQFTVQVMHELESVAKSKQIRSRGQ